MSFQLQRQIRNNAQEIRSYVGDLYEWQEEMALKEKARQKVKKQNPALVTPPVSPPRVEKKQEVSEKQGGNEPKKQLARDANTVGEYYKAWNQFDIDSELKKLEEEELAASYKPYNPYEDSRNTVRAKPQVQMKIKGKRSFVADPTSLKQRGNLHFKTCEYAKAIQSYTECLQKLQAIEESTTQNTKLKCVVYSNRGMAHLKNNETMKALQDCNESLTYDDRYIKTYYRRAECLRKLRKYKESLRDYETILKISADEKEAMTEVKKIKLFMENRYKEARESMIINNFPQHIPGTERIPIEEVASLKLEQEDIKEKNYLEEL